MIDTEKLKAKEGWYHKEMHSKNKIVLHFTAGFSALGCHSAFVNHKNGTAFIVDRDGTTYQYFDPRYWASHLYRHEHGENPDLYKLERETIGIEIVNVAYLVQNRNEKDNMLYTYTDKPFCSLDETNKYVQAEFRGHYYWQSFTESQYISVRNLLISLNQAFNINIETPFIDEYNRLDVIPTEKLVNYNGVTTHCNYRSDKFDIGPAWDWGKVGL